MITIFKALLMALFKSFIAGVISTLITYLLFFDFYKTRNFEALEGVGMIFFSLLLSFAFCAAVLFPISILEKENDKSTGAEVLFKRYLPFITLPLFSLFCLILFSYDQSRSDQDIEYYFCLRALIIAFCIGTTGLWTFLKSKRS
jgi:hypothetical protein